MKQLLFLFIYFPIATFSQNFEKVDSMVSKYPRFSKVEDLANQIDTDFSSDIHKSRAAFFWLTKNIRYNLKEFYNPRRRSSHFKYSSEEDRLKKIQNIKDNLVAETFKNKTGVCEEYAQSFKKICDLLNIQSEVIKGNIRSNATEIGKIATNTNHAWNTVKIDGNWFILDATWAAGYEYNGKWIRDFNDYFFNIPKDKIFKTYFPKDKIWVIRFGRMTAEEFYNQPIFSNTFLALQADLLSPKTGIINLKTSEDIVLKFKNLDPNLLIFYAFKGTKNAQKPIITSEKDTTIVIIKNPRRHTELVLYINELAALQFKIKSN
jgi:transglutaminase/protease-like cytokinesis protein 3